MPFIINPFAYVEGLPRHWNDLVWGDPMNPLGLAYAIHMLQSVTPLTSGEVQWIRYYLSHFIFAPGLSGDPDEYDRHGRHIHLEPLMESVSGLSTTSEILAWAWEARQVTGMDPL